MVKGKKITRISEWGNGFIEIWHPGSEERAAKDLPGIVHLLNLKHPVKILDCPCGWGRFSNPLAAMGHEVAGIDIDKTSIQMAKEKSPKNNPPAFKVGDMRNLKIEGEYDVVLNLYGSFGYFERYTDYRVLTSFIDGLKPNGQLMIDQSNWEKVIRLPKSILYELPNGKKCLKEQSVDLIKGIYSVRNTIIGDTEERVMELTMNWYTVAEYRAMLEKLGVSNFRFYGNFDGSEYSVDSDRQIVIAIKDK
jgi:2-polyprenyl-3-methyl-5-hydroxy-6-metoxy-1,4-benzoquinol methylase